MASAGHWLTAARTSSSCPAGTSVVRTTAYPSSVSSNTSGAMAQQTPWPPHFSSSTNTLTWTPSRRRELDVQSGQTAQDEGGHVDVASIARWAVLVHGDADVGRAVEQPLDAHAGLRTRQRRTGTGVHAAAERDVLAGVGAMHVEPRRIVEAPRVAVGGGDEQHQGRPGGDVDAAERRVGR